MKNLMTLAFVMLLAIGGISAQSAASYTPTYKMTPGHQLRDLQHLLDLNKDQMQVLKDYYTTTATAQQVELDEVTTSEDRLVIMNRYQTMRDDKVYTVLDEDQVAPYEQYLHDRVHREQDAPASESPALPGVGGGR